MCRDYHSPGVALSHVILAKTRPAPVSRRRPPPRGTAVGSPVGIISSCILLVCLSVWEVFRPHLERSPWMRFNVSACEDKRVQLKLQRQVAGKVA